MSFRALRLATGHSFLVLGFCGTSIFYSSSIASHVIPDAILVHLINDADIRWNLYRAIDDDATPSRDKLAIAVAGLLCQHPITLLTVPCLVQLVPPVRRLISSRISRALLSRLRRVLSPPSSSSSSIGGVFLRSAITGFVAGAALWHCTIGANIFFTRIATTVANETISSVASLDSAHQQYRVPPLLGAVGVAALMLGAATAWIPSSSSTARDDDNEKEAEKVEASFLRIVAENLGI